jgi:hypothetical protein
MPTGDIPPSAPALLALQREAGNRSIWRAIRLAEENADRAASTSVVEQHDERDEEAPERQEPAPLRESPEGEALALPPVHWGRREPVGEGQVSWAATGTPPSAAQASPATWGAIQSLGGPKEGVSEAIIGAVVKSLNVVQNTVFFDANRLGATTFPSASRAPSFGFNTFSTKNKAGKTQWFAKPKLLTKADEGNSNAFYVGPGLHKTTHKEFIMVAKGGKGKAGGKVKVAAPVFWDMSKAMSALDQDAENEHSNDFKHAYEISLKEAERVLNSFVVGKQFGPEPTPAAAKNLVLTAIKTNLAFPKLGNDQAKWAAKYSTLQDLTLQRDKNAWHSFGLGGRKEAGGKVIYTVQKGTTKINVVKSKTLITY